MNQLNLFPLDTPPQTKQLTRPLRIGDRIIVSTWGSQKATVVKIKPLTVIFDGRDYETQLSAKNIKGVGLLEECPNNTAD